MSNPYVIKNPIPHACKDCAWDGLPDCPHATQERRCEGWQPIWHEQRPAQGVPTWYDLDPQA